MASQKKDLAAELRGEVAASGIPAYHIASSAELHPCRLSMILRGHTPLSPEIAERIRAAIAVRVRQQAASR